MAVCNFRNTQAMRVMSSYKILIIDLDFRNGAKNSEKFSCFLDNWIWTGCGKFSPLRREYLSLTANVLTNSFKIWDITKRDIFQLNFPHIDEKIRWKCCHADFNSLSDPLACWLGNGVLKRGFLDIHLNTYLAVCNSQNT